ncbi:protein phosphatase 1 regulatory subunit 14A-like [Mustelus asterias]
MAAQRAGRRAQGRMAESHREAGAALQRRQARVTARYDRRHLQQRLELESWIGEQLEQLNPQQVEQIPEEVNIDDLLELQTDDERRTKLQVMLTSCSRNTDEFVSQLLSKLKGLHKVEVQKVGTEATSQH